ncbi:helix-turn-helix domain-containing protein [Paenibacillus dakarensis]|uniref:helix-turn-helix domain-containing protein n=1 Tax=Paenibacillus dakarensis TaxID=1527293 RepID=UPI0006D5B13C|nr:helix-turn-helix domain-containing protein [Paenibacillus dakarensis]
MKPHPPKPSMGVLHLAENSSQFSLIRCEPSAAFRPFIKHYWMIHWDLTGKPAHHQDVVPNPCVNLVVESGKTAIYGVSKSVHSHHLEGSGSVFGIKFKPGGFYPFIKKPLSALTDQSIGTADVLGISPADMEQLILSKQKPEQQVACIEQLLLPCLPPPDQTVNHINQIIDHIIQNPALTTVEQLCEWAHLNKRTLQRMFSQYVGVHPKWVIKLYRLQHAAERMDYRTHEDLLKLSVDLGYYDQSHFIKDFKSIVGKTPEEYMRGTHSPKQG